MTLGGFALAIGRLVDDSTVVLENINRHLAEGKAPPERRARGADEVALPVLASTITTIIVFFPVMFLFGVAKYLVQRAGAGGGALDARFVRRRDDGDPDLLRAFSDR